MAAAAGSHRQVIKLTQYTDHDSQSEVFSARIDVRVSEKLSLQELKSMNQQFDGVEVCKRYMRRELLLKLKALIKAEEEALKEGR